MSFTTKLLYNRKRIDAMNGLSDKRKQFIERMIESIIDDSQDLIDDVVQDETGTEVKKTLITLYSEMIWDELYSDYWEDAGDEIEDQEMNDIEPVIKKALCNMSKKIGKMIQESMERQKNEWT